jgi:hypothetical protein
MKYERKTMDILISSEIKDLLKEIESQSLVAGLLLKSRIDKDLLVDDPINWISVSSQDRTKISYLTNERAEKMPESEHWSSSKRFHAKPGAFVSKIFKNIDSREIEKFSTLFRNISNRVEIRFDILNGNSLKKYYLESSYISSSGSLGASCMRYNSSQKYLNLYTENYSIVKMLVMLDSNDMLIGRALLWDLDDNKIMDRIYTSNDEEYQFYFKEWATKNGYLYKSKQNWSDTMSFENLNTPKTRLKIAIKLNESIFDFYPYMDTFKFIDFRGKTIYNYHPNVKFSTLCSSEGEIYSDDYLVMDSIDGVFRYRGDAHYLDYRDIWTSIDNLIWSEVNNRYILNGDCVYSREIDDYLFISEYDEFNNKERLLLNS